LPIGADEAERCRWTTMLTVSNRCNKVVAPKTLQSAVCPSVCRGAEAEYQADAPQGHGLSASVAGYLLLSMATTSRVRSD